VHEQKHIIRAAESKGGRDTIDWADADAVRLLNTALLRSDYGVSNWEIPDGKLCPPVPGRADYIHQIADVLRDSAGGADVPQGRQVVGMDIGTGASLIYPLIGASEYGWKFISSECDTDSFASAQRIASANAQLDIDVRLQPDASKILQGVLNTAETVDFVMCNPPFFDSPEAFMLENARKQRNLLKNAHKRGSPLVSRTARGARTRTANTLPRGAQGAAQGSNNFAGDASELWCAGGEVAFIKKMAQESQVYYCSY